MWNYLHNLSEIALKKARTPLLVKEAAWRLISWVAKAGKFDPVSWLVRPWVAHKGLKRTVGMAIAGISLVAALGGQADTGGPLEVNVLP
ncbi:MAG: hypothetical protein AAB697_02025 [Patescibacteria group bacterium]